jgi:hypothetical protein
MIVRILLLTNIVTLSAVASEPMLVLDDTLTFRDTCAIVGYPLQMHYRIYLPGSAAVDDSIRYPVVYFLPGHDGTPASIEELFGLPEILEEVMEFDSIPEFITVVVDPSLPGGLGSFYVNSPLIANWEDAIVHDLTLRVDRLFPTIPARDSRMIAGFSAGGYGAAYCGLRNASVFGGILSMSGVLTPDSLASIWLERVSIIPEWTPQYFLDNHERYDDFFYSRMLMSMYLSFGPWPDSIGASAPFTTGSGGLQLPDSVLSVWSGAGIPSLAARVFTDSCPATELPLRLFFSVGTGDNVIYRFGQEELAELLAGSTSPTEWQYYSYNGSHGGGVRGAFRKGIVFLFKSHFTAGSFSRITNRFRE